MVRLVTRGRFTQDYVKGILAMPEDREPAVRKLVEAVGGKVINFYFTTGETDFLLIAEANESEALIAALMAARRQAQSPISALQGLGLARKAKQSPKGLPKRRAHIERRVSTNRGAHARGYSSSDGGLHCARGRGFKPTDVCLWHFTDMSVARIEARF